MKINQEVSQSEVFTHWERVEKISIWNRADIVFPLVAYSDLVWNLAEIEDEDIEKLYICSSIDWNMEGLCVPDFKLSTAIENYQRSAKNYGKYLDIKTKEDIFARDLAGLDTKLILVADNPSGPYTLIEGCKRSVALGNLQKLSGLKIYFGVSPAIKTYIWARNMY